MDTKPIKGSWKERLVHELIDYWLVFLYLAVFLTAFAEYRRLILADHSISYTSFGIPLLKALVLAKFVLLINALHLGRRMEHKPLVFSALYKVFVFTITVFFFDLIEEVVRGLLKGNGLVGVREQLARMDKYAALANGLVIFLSFIPFFAFMEMGRVMGREKIVRMFFSERTGDDAEAASEKK
jgi:hypothetical protein